MILKLTLRIRNRPYSHSVVSLFTGPHYHRLLQYSHYDSYINKCSKVTSISSDVLVLPLGVLLRKVKILLLRSVIEIWRYRFKGRSKTTKQKLVLFLVYENWFSIPTIDFGYEKYFHKNKLFVKLPRNDNGKNNKENVYGVNIEFVGRLHLV